MPLLLLATLSLNAVALVQLNVSAQQIPSRMGWLMALTDAVIIGQLQVFAVWLAVGGRAWIWRFLSVTLTVAMYAIALSPDTTQVSYWVAVAMLYLVVGGLLSRLVIVIAGRLRKSRLQPARRRRRRFKVGNLMALIFACSVAFAVLVQADFTMALTGWVTILVSSVMLASFVAISLLPYRAMAFLLIANLPLNLTALLQMSGYDAINDVSYLYEHQIIYGIFVAAWLVGARVQRKPKLDMAPDETPPAQQGTAQQDREVATSQTLRLFQPIDNRSCFQKPIDFTV